MNTKRILLAEDNPNDIELTLEALSDQNLGNRVDVVNDGVQVLDYLRRQGAYADREPNPPLLILLDLKMPRMDGLQVLRELKTDPNLKCIPVVILTSSREESDLVDSYDLGVNGYVVKPVQFDQFMEAIRHIGLYWVLTNEPPVGGHTDDV
ncbi:MAG: response regulator [Pyrinomonadaceae bacterium]